VEIVQMNEVLYFSSHIVQGVRWGLSLHDPKKRFEKAALIQVADMIPFSLGSPEVFSGVKI
jgi:hypothetical protein